MLTEKQLAKLKRADILDIETYLDDIGKALTQYSGTIEYSGTMVWDRHDTTGRARLALKEMKRLFDVE